MWLTFRYQEPSPWATKPPIPQRPRPNEKWSVISTGRSAAVNFAAATSAPIAVGPGIVTDLPLPPVPAPKHVAFGLAATETAGVPTVGSASTLPPVFRTRRSTT